MKEFVRFPLAEKLVYYEQASAKLNLPVPAVEKDFWVCWILGKLFAVPEWKDHLTFKGGTSLSKAWNLIQRFSEDIDLVVSRSLLGFDGDSDPEQAATPSQVKKRIKRLKKAARDRVSGELTGILLAAVVEEVPDSTEEQVLFDEDDTDNCTVLFRYPRATSDESMGIMLPHVKIEMGPRGDAWPAHTQSIVPYLAQGLPGSLSGDGSVSVNVLDAERTFLEKVMLLHENASRPEGRPIKPRMSRHYYDLYCMINAGTGVRSLADDALWERVVGHRKFYYPVSWVDYETMVPGSIKIVPGQTAMSDWIADYSAMRDVFFFGDAPTFDRVIATVQSFQDELNSRAES